MRNIFKKTIILIISIILIIITIGLSPISCQKEGGLSLIAREKVKQGIEYYFKTYLESRYSSSELVPSENNAKTNKIIENSFNNRKLKSLQSPEGEPNKPIETTTSTEDKVTTTIVTTDDAASETTAETTATTIPVSETTVETTATTQSEQFSTSQPPVSSDYISKMLNLINEVRAEQGFLPLSLNSTLFTIACSRSNDMLARDYFSHTTPEGKNIFIILQENGVGYKSAGENIERSYPASNASAEMYFTNWMNSSVHRENILNGSFSQIGISFGSKDGWFVSTLVFLG